MHDPPIVRPSTDQAGGTRKTHCPLDLQDVPWRRLSVRQHRRASLEQSAHVVGRDVPVDSVLDRLGFWDRAEVDRVERQAGDVLHPGEPTLVVDRGAAEDVSPPPGLRAGRLGVRRVDDHLVEHGLAAVAGNVVAREQAQLAALRIERLAPRESRTRRRRHLQGGAESQHRLDGGDVHVEVHPLLDRARLGHGVDPDGLLGLLTPQGGVAVVVQLDLEAEHRTPECGRCGGRRWRRCRGPSSGRWPSRQPVSSGGGTA